MALQYRVDFSIRHRLAVLIGDGESEVSLAELLDASKRLLAPGRIGFAAFIRDQGVRELLKGKGLSVVEEAQTADIQLLHLRTEMNGHTALAFGSLFTRDEWQDHGFPLRAHPELGVSQFRVLRGGAYLDIRGAAGPALYSPC